MQFSYSLAGFWPSSLAKNAKIPQIVDSLQSPVQCKINEVGAVVIASGGIGKQDVRMLYEILILKIQLKAAGSRKLMNKCCTVV